MGENSKQYNEKHLQEEINAKKSKLTAQKDRINHFVTTNQQIRKQYNEYIRMATSVNNSEVVETKIPTFSEYAKDQDHFANQRKYLQSILGQDTDGKLSLLEDKKYGFNEAGLDNARGDLQKIEALEYERRVEAVRKEASEHLKSVLNKIPNPASASALVNAYKDTISLVHYTKDEQIVRSKETWKTNTILSKHGEQDFTPLMKAALDICKEDYTHFNQKNFSPEEKKIVEDFFNHYADEKNYAELHNNAATEITVKRDKEKLAREKEKLASDIKDQENKILELNRNIRIDENYIHNNSNIQLEDIENTAKELTAVQDFYEDKVRETIVEHTSSTSSTPREDRKNDIVKLGYDNYRGYVSHTTYYFWDSRQFPEALTKAVEFSLDGNHINDIFLTPFLSKEDFLTPPSSLITSLYKLEKDKQSLTKNLEYLEKQIQVDQEKLSEFKNKILDTYENVEKEAAHRLKEFKKDTLENIGQLRASIQEKKDEQKELTQTLEENQKENQGILEEILKRQIQMKEDFDLKHPDVKVFAENLKTFLNMLSKYNIEFLDQSHHMKKDVPRILWNILEKSKDLQERREELKNIETHLQKLHEQLADLSK